MRLGLALACFFGTVAIASAQAPPASLTPPSVPQPSNSWIVARGDFDGDGMIDTVEKTPDLREGSTRLLVRLAARPDAPYLLVESSSGGLVERMPVETGHAGPYVVQTAYGRPPAFEFRTESMQMRNDVVLLTVNQPGSRRLVKYWSPTINNFVGLTLVD